MKNKLIRISYIKVFYIISLFIVSGIGYFYGVYVNVNNNKVYSQNNNAIISDSTNNVIANIQSLIDDRFINSKASSTLPNSQDLQDGIISGFVSAYNDPYTQYFNPRIAKTFNQTISGSFGGIGIEITYKNSNITIVSPLKNTPSYKAGLKSGDIILSVDDISVDNQTTDVVITKIRGEVGTSVNIKIYRPETKETKEFTIIRDIIKVPVVDSKIIGDYFVISLYTFTTDSPELFKKEMIKFLQSGKTNLILDLRGNPGGSVDSAILISSYFLNNGDTIFKEIGKNKVVKLNNALDLKVFDITKYKLYVLVDSGSASASEIVAGALQEHGLAHIYGNKTFGKGSVQELVPLSGSGAYLKMTIANWFTPNGVSITEKGIVPDFELKRNASTTADIELKSMIELIKKNNKTPIIKKSKSIQVSNSTSTAI